MLRLGVDVGGTNTDAVLVRGAHVQGATKAATTPDVTGGISTALQNLRAHPGFDPADIEAVMIGTTHFINALIEGSRLAPTGVIRFGLPATRALPPLVDWPERLRTAVGDNSHLCHGGHEYDGSPRGPFDEAEFRAALTAAVDAGAQSIALSSVFSPVNASYEQQAAEIVAAELPGTPVSLSHEIGRVGLLGRENATVVNAALRGLAEHVTSGLLRTVTDAGIHAPVYLSQNDGTLMDTAHAQRYPVATFISGPTNSMRGAAFLSGHTSCAVVDVGGTTTDVGMLQAGFPREAATDVSVAGVHTNFRMPDVLSVGIGGGSHVRTDGGPTVGPDSAGYELSTRALVFGGDQLTATDIAVAAGRADIGDAHRVRHLSRSLVDHTLDHVAERMAETVDRMRVSAEPVPVVAVGGGSMLVPGNLPGASEVLRPEYFATANAVGAAIAHVGGEVDRVFALTPEHREAVLDEARQEAVDHAVAAGARPDTVHIVDIEEVPLAYLPGNATRIRVKAVGDLSVGDSDA